MVPTTEGRLGLGLGLGLVTLGGLPLAPTRGNPPRTARTCQNWRGRRAEHSNKAVSF